MFVACGIWCLADISSVSPLSEQTDEGTASSISPSSKQTDVSSVSPSSKQTAPTKG